MKTDRLEIAVAIHDVEPATFERVALVRDWLDDHGIGRATLLVVPAPDLHPLGDRHDGLVAWLGERRRMGDSIAQHGLRDRCEWRTRWSPAAPLRRKPRPDAEFTVLDPDETRRAVDSGWRIMRLAGLEPTGFVAPAYAYTPALHATLGRRFAWWAGMTRLYGPDGPAAGTATGPPLAFDAAGRARKLAAPSMLRVRAALAGRVLRLDLKPSDLESRRHVAAVERVLLASRGRIPVTLDEVALSASMSRAEAR
jgi:predicted deacetylase